MALACVCAGLGFTTPVLAELFPTLLPPVQAWHYRTLDSCINSKGKDYYSQYPGDSPEDALDQYIADKNALCKTYGGWLNTYSRVPGIVPTIHASDADSLYPAVVAQGYKIHIQHDPLPSCPTCQAWSEEKILGWPDRQCGHTRTIGDWNQPGFFLEDNPSYGVCKCGAGRTYVAAVKRCVRRLDLYKSTEQCPGPEQGNPINVLRGFKRERIALDNTGLFELAIEYSSRPMVPADDPLARFEGDSPVSFGPLWNSTLHRAVRPQGLTSQAVAVGLGSGQWQSFAISGSQYVPVISSDSKLVRSWRYTNIESSRQDVFYSDDGRIQVSHLASGIKYTYIHSTDDTPKDVAPARGYTIGVVDPFGRQVAFTYEQPADTKLAPRINTVTRVDGEVIRFLYSSHGYLNQIQWPGGKSKSFLYERTDLPWALTGIVDEDDQRYATFGYDAEGRATSTEYAFETNRFSTRWTTPPRWLIQDTYDADADVVRREHTWISPDGTERQNPLGHWSTVTSSVVNGIPRQTSSSRPAGSGCDASASQTEYDSRGNVLSRLDFGEAGSDRRRSCHAYQTDRHVETHRVEGLLESNSCPPDLAAYQVPPELPAQKPQRKITTMWHPLWKLETRRAEPKRITTTVYNGEKDPLDNNAVVSCAVGAPKLPDGVTPIAVVCRRYEQSTNDETGNQGLLVTPTGTRKWRYEYNQYGQVTLEEDPRLKQTTYEYYDTTAFNGDGAEHTMGDLKLTRNALGQVTQYLDYNKRGQVRKIQHPNGSVEERQYHVRGWLTQVTLTPAAGGVPELTQYEYYPTGLLKQVTQPDGNYAIYTWDAAHRLIGVEDKLGNKVTYALDNAGNREREEYWDPNDVLKKTIKRTFDALGRMDSSTGLLH